MTAGNGWRTKGGSRAIPGAALPQLNSGQSVERVNLSSVAFTDIHNTIRDGWGGVRKIAATERLAPCHLQGTGSSNTQANYTRGDAGDTWASVGDEEHIVRRVIGRNTAYATATQRVVRCIQGKDLKRLSANGQISGTEQVEIPILATGSHHGGAARRLEDSWRGGEIKIARGSSTRDGAWSWSLEISQ